MMRKLLLCALILAILLGAGYLTYIARQIHVQSSVDEAQPADVILVMGAAEYRGKPSPALRARLDHGLNLYRRKLAPRILTTGGAGGDPVFTEGEVGRDYLVRQGVPSEAILLEDEGESTIHSIAVSAEIMRQNNLHSAIVVSDGYHLFRAKKMLQAQGVKAYGSPRPFEPKGTWRETWLYFRQAAGYVLWQAGITI
ncbi:MAG TPA: YdcF family protein [Bryobacteraceae bacterium]|nr:YdcF family protein [Bryobacteraceae bacterium]